MNRNSHQSVKKQAYDFNVFLKAGVRRPWATGDATQQRLGARCWSWSLERLDAAAVGGAALGRALAAAHFSSSTE